MLKSHDLENTMNANNDYHSQLTRQAKALGMSSLAMKGAGIIHGAPASAATPGANPKKAGYPHNLPSNILSPRRYPDSMEYNQMELTREPGMPNAPGLPSAAQAVKNGLQNQRLWRDQTVQAEQQVMSSPSYPGNLT